MNENAPFSVKERRYNLELAYARQGYLVVSLSEPVRIGEILRGFDPLFPASQPFRVMARATTEEAEAQLRFLAGIYGEEFRNNFPYTYKVVTE